MQNIFILFTLICLASCGNPSLSDLASTVTGTDVLKPDPVPGDGTGDDDSSEPNDPDPTPGDPSDPSDPSDPTPPQTPVTLPPPVNDPQPEPAPGSYKVSIEAKKVKVSKSKRPYRLIRKKTYEKSRAAIWCLFRQKGECVKNRQVFFETDTNAYRSAINQGMKLKSLHLQMDFTSFIYHFETEMLCLLNDPRCSGQAVGMNFKEPLRSLKKLKYWNKKFFGSRGIEGEDIIKTTNFMWRINDFWDEGAKKNHSDGEYFNLITLLDYSADEFSSLMMKDDTLQFMIGDDTYVQNVKLIAVFEEAK